MNAMTQNITAAGSNILSSRAMLARVNVSQWTARKLDKRVTRETNDAHGAAHDAGRYNKKLIGQGALDAIEAIATEARTYHYGVTLPWLDNGARILPAALYLDYTNKMRAYRERFDAAVSAFVADYPAHVEQARRRLNGMFAAGDYPTSGEIAARFAFSVRVLPVPAPNDFRVAIGDAAADNIRTEIEAAAREALAGAMRDAWQRVAESVGRMAERLATYKPAGDGARAAGVFRDSLVENVRALVAILPALNIAGDPELNAIAERMARELCAHDAGQLRDSAELRESVRDAAAAILADVSAYI